MYVFFSMHAKDAQAYSILTQYILYYLISQYIYYLNLILTSEIKVTVKLSEVKRLPKRTEPN